MPNTMPGSWKGGAFLSVSLFKVEENLSWKLHSHSSQQTGLTASPAHDLFYLWAMGKENDQL